MFLLFFFRRLIPGSCLQEIPFANDERTAQSIITELNVLIKSKSDYIVRFYGAFFHETKVCYCMEYMDYGSLDRLYTQRMTEPVLARIAYAVRAAHLFVACACWALTTARRWYKASCT